MITFQQGFLLLPLLTLLNQFLRFAFGKRLRVLVDVGELIRSRCGGGNGFWLLGRLRELPFPLALLFCEPLGDQSINLLLRESSRLLICRLFGCAFRGRRRLGRLHGFRYRGFRYWDLILIHVIPKNPRSTWPVRFCGL